MDDDTIRTLVTRLARPHASGGEVVERAAILAEGLDSTEVLTWIAARGGVPDVAVPKVASRGLHSSRIDDGGRTGHRAPQRYVLPPGALS